MENKPRKRVYWLNGKYVPVRELDKLVKKNRAWHISVYDLSGGPVPPEALERLDNFATQISKEYNLVVNRMIV